MTRILLDAVKEVEMRRRVDAGNEVDVVVERDEDSGSCEESEGS